MPIRCDAEVARGDICAQCHREHRYIFTGWRIAGICLAAALTVGGILWYLTSATANEWKYDTNRGPYKMNAYTEPNEETGEIRPRRVPTW